MTTEIYFVPNTTEGSTPMLSLLDLSQHYKAVLPDLDGVFAESLGGGRKWLKMIDRKLPVIAIDHTKPEQVQFDLEQIRGQKWAYVTDAGYPCIADPGAIVVKLAREMDINIHLLPGTSAIIAAIALCGLSGQRFAFHGYLPRGETDLKDALKELERASKPRDDSWQGGVLQVFIEVYHRYGVMLKNCLATLEDRTWLAVAKEVGNTGQKIEVRRVGEWKKDARVLEEEKSQVAVFLLLNEDKSVQKNRSSEAKQEGYRQQSSHKNLQEKKRSSRGKHFFN